jgi:hypothetical protein
MSPLHSFRICSGWQADLSAGNYDCLVSQLPVDDGVQLPQKLCPEQACGELAEPSTIFLILHSYF